MDTIKYLERINYTGSLEPSFDVLSKLQRNHLLSVPFENMDIHTNTKIDLDNLFHKIVSGKRGGFCYELNGLFYQLLKELQFTVKIISARVYSDKKEFGEEFDHMALIVTIKDDHYLVDVGFGEFTFLPLKIEINKNQNDPRGIFRIENFDTNYMVVKKQNPTGEFIPEYIFTEKERKLEEFYKMCYYHQTNKESHFVQNRICSLATENGRITITGNTLKRTENDRVTERQLNNEEEIQYELWNCFGIRF